VSVVDIVRIDTELPKRRLHPEVAARGFAVAVERVVVVAVAVGADEGNSVVTDSRVVAYHVHRDGVQITAAVAVNRQLWVGASVTLPLFDQFEVVENVVVDAHRASPSSLRARRTK